MNQQLIHFFAMGGYATYVWSAYSIVIVGLGIPLFVSFFRWKKYLGLQNKN